MSRVLVFQHVAAEPLGTLDPLLRKRGHRVKFVNFERQPDAQPNIDRYRGLIVLGGPMNVEDQHSRPHLKTELHVIEQALVQGKPVLGICLGAQLLAHALGAPIRRHDPGEIGWYDLQTTDEGRDDPVLGAFGAGATVFQWHRYTFDLPQGAQHLARTAGCENQAFRYGSNAYGVQFHPEVNAALIERWLGIPAYRDELIEAGLGATPEAIRARTAEMAATMQENAGAAFNRFLDQVGRPRRLDAEPDAIAAVRQGNV